MGVLAALFAACGGSPAVSSGTIAPTEFSEETREALSILNDELAYFDYEAPETIQSFSIELWTYSDGQWSGGPIVFGNVKPGRQRLAVRISDYSYDIFTVSDGASVSQPALVEFPASDMIITSRLTQSTAIEPGKDIPLWVRLSTDQTSVPADFAGDFRTADCTASVAVTITFSEQAVD